MIEQLSVINSVLKSVNKKTALAPALYLLGFVGAVLCVFSFNNNKDMLIISYIVAAIFALLVLGIFVMFAYALINKPELLQSESYRLEEKKLNFISEKTGKVRVNPINMELSLPTNQLTEGGQND